MINIMRSKVLNNRVIAGASKLVSKFRAIPSFLGIKFENEQARARKRGQLHIRSLRDLGHPEYVTNVEYSLDNGKSYIDTVGIYSFSQIYLHRQTGLSLIRIDDNDWPIGIKESSNIEFQELSIRRRVYRNANKIVDSDCFVYNFELPCTIFVPRNDNFFHFLIDS